MSVPVRRVSPDDIESKFRELQGEVDVVTDEIRSYAVTVGAAVVVGLVLVAFVLGRRKGKRQRTYVEIRRV
ncbi:MAG: hypothetical protein MUF83_02895 [Acidimicrobiales bacterium]|jgi:hypothetical protein|nr:hypothetical protein [Acidimicrobiales bacterium]